jgi:hypothetical protein
MHILKVADVCQYEPGASTADEVVVGDSQLNCEEICTKVVQQNAPGKYFVSVEKRHAPNLPLRFFRRGTLCQSDHLTVTPQYSSTFTDNDLDFSASPSAGLAAARP